MSDPRIAHRYAQALYDVCTPENREQVAERLTTFVTVLSDTTIREFLFHPLTPSEAKRRLVVSMNAGEPLQRFLLLVVEKGREALLLDMAREFRRQTNYSMQKAEATVTTAIPLNKDTVKTLQMKLGEVTGKTVSLRSHVEPAILGGMIIQIEGKVINGSLSHTLTEMKQRLLAR